MMDFLRKCLFACGVALCAASCGGGEGGEDDAARSGPVALDLGDGGGTAKAAEEGRASEAALRDEEDGAGRAGPAEAGGGEGGTRPLVVLDQWLRAPAAERRRHQGGGAAAEELEAFSALWEGSGQTYRARVRLQPVEVFGDGYRALAAAYAEDGTAGLENALAATSAAEPVQLAWREVLARQSARLQEPARAGRALAQWIPAALAAGYDRARVLEIEDAVAAVAEQADAFLPHEDYVVQPNDSYWEICMQYRRKGMPLGHGWIKAYNGRSSDGIRLGETLEIPTATLKMDVWRDARLAMVSADGHPIRLYEISVGKESEPTPLGEFTVRTFESKPVYYKQGAAAVPYGNPDNPLGERWLGFEEDPQYGLHGTNSEDTIGSFESGGCIRFHNEAIIELFDLLAPGVGVEIHP